MLELKILFTSFVREFFQNNSFQEITSPPAVQNPGMEVHIHPFQLYSVNEKITKTLYLHTSPEFFLKSILSKIDTNLIPNIFSLGYVFRDEPSSPIHRQQFLMLEWYRVNHRYETIMNDTEKLIISMHQKLQEKNIPILHKNLQMTKRTMTDFIEEFLKFNITHFLDKNEFKHKIQKDFKSVPLPSVDCEWDDYFFLVFLNLIEPHLKHFPLLMLSEFPAPLAALSTIKTDNPLVCERFEVYMDGIEVCNAFNELRDPIEQAKRFSEQSNLKNKFYKYKLPEPNQFMSAINSGLPMCAGNAMGVERVLKALTGIENPFLDL
jgi:lysyl-tRNA synthetase class 2